MQRSAGYFLSGSVAEDKIWFLHGGGRNGKGTFVDQIAGAMGSYAVNTPSSTFMKSKNAAHPEAIARLAGARLVKSDEVTKGSEWNEELLKTISGGGVLTARPMYGSSFDFKPQFKPLIVGNNKPILKTVDVAIKSRFLLIPFDVDFDALGKIDPDLREVTLPKERSGILRWMINGFAAYQRDGLNPPRIVLDASEEYLEEQDEVKTWLDERCQRGPILVSTTSDLFANWSVWMKSKGASPGSDKVFAESLKKEGFKREKYVGAKRKRGFRGLALQRNDLFPQADELAEA